MTGSPTSSPSRSGNSVTCAEDSPERPVADTVSNTNTQGKAMIKPDNNLRVGQNSIGMTRGP